jgi:hypothetical protein
MQRSRVAILSALIGAALFGSGCAPSGSNVNPAGSPDAAFAALQTRGHEAMGVDQYTSTHRFDALADGGRIELQRDVDDPAGIAEVRRHLQEIAEAFRSGDFSTPAFVHEHPVPGTAVMALKRDAIIYTYSDLPRGGEVRLITEDPQALEAIQEFMAFQRQDHRAGGMDHGTMHPGTMDHGAMHPGTMDHGTMDHGAMRHETTPRKEAVPAQVDSAFVADMGIVHELVVNHQAIERTVLNLPNGIRTKTESTDRRVARYLKDHVASMDDRLKKGAIFNMGSPSLPTIFENRERIRTEIEETENGVAVTQTSDDPATVAALQAHASEVSELVREGMASMMRSMMSNGAHGVH